MIHFRPIFRNNYFNSPTPWKFVIVSYPKIFKKNKSEICNKRDISLCFVGITLSSFDYKLTTKCAKYLDAWPNKFTHNYQGSRH